MHHSLYMYICHQNEGGGGRGTVKKQDSYISHHFEVRLLMNNEKGCFYI